jgi:hypothetical protein
MAIVNDDGRKAASDCNMPLLSEVVQIRMPQVPYCLRHYAFEMRIAMLAP